MSPALLYLYTPIINIFMVYYHVGWSTGISYVHNLTQQNQQVISDRASEHSPIERDSLMQSDEASETSRKTWTASSQRSSRHMEDEYSDAYQDLYQPHRHHNSGLHNTNGHDSQDRLLERDSEQNHNDRNWQRNRPWPKDSYWAGSLCTHPLKTHPHTFPAWQCMPWGTATKCKFQGSNKS